MFTPPFCPYRTCSQHRNPTRRFYLKSGVYHAKCRAHPVPRFRCSSCRRTFSRQTFRADYRDHKPHLNSALFDLLSSGVGLRQAARKLGLSRRCTELKFRKIARHLRRLNLRLRERLGGKRRFHLDEFESYEGQRNTRPVTIPMLIESDTRYIVWAESAPIRPGGKMTPKRLDAIARAEARYGPRRTLSSRAVRRTLARGVAFIEPEASVILRTDKKSTYPRLARNAFGADRTTHLRTDSKLERTIWNPLFPINHEEALARDLMGRLRRESWLVSKKRRYLDLALHLHIAYRNLVRRRFNTDEESPAQLLGFTPRRLTSREVLSWSQVWGARSPHPLTGGGPRETRLRAA